MLQLKNITKDYVTSSETVHALRGIDISFRDHEFVSILGASGCGKTTLLNIVGGLDHYTSGDLVINGKSTKLYRDRDWDVYRNHRVGFIFQSYNLIPHQTVLGNVELALYLIGPASEESLSVPYPGLLLSAQQSGTHIDLNLQNLPAAVSEIEFSLICACLALTSLDITGAEDVTIYSGDRTRTLNRESLTLYDTDVKPISTEETQ